MCIRFSASLKEKIQELTVEDKMLSMTEIKIKEEVKAMERELLEVGKLMVEESIVISIMIMITILISMQVGRLMVEEEAVRREKIAGCNAAREMHEAQVVPCLVRVSNPLAPGRGIYKQVWRETFLVVHQQSLTSPS